MRSMLKFDPSQSPPPYTVAAIEALWDELSIDPCAGVSPEVERLLVAIRTTHDNGGVEFARFRVGPIHYRTAQSGRPARSGVVVFERERLYFAIIS